MFRGGGEAQESKCLGIIRGCGIVGLTSDNTTTFLAVTSQHSRDIRESPVTTILLLLPVLARKLLW